jgi:DNA-binding NarL/FixJ family response regulator
VRGEADAAAAVLAALNGAQLIVEAHASRDVIDRLCDDLRRMGTLEHRVGPATVLPRLSGEQLQLLRCLLAGSSLGQAAAELHISRRTADRRIADIRQLLGASSTSAALVRAVQLGLSAARGSEA